MIVTKNNAARLGRTLRQWADLGAPVTLIDDSSTESERSHSRQAALKAGAIYHGREAQRAVLSGVKDELKDGLVGRLGGLGWTLGACRNYSLLVGRATGFRRLLLVDDDIELRTRDLAAKSLSLLDRFDFVGATTAGYPDDSEVGHLARNLGTVQYDFVTGQYLGLKVGTRKVFFPEVYNEDLIFLLLQLDGQKAARLGEVSQLNPGRSKPSVERAAFQERGEIMFEGCVRALLEHDSGLLRSPAMWRETLDFRERCLSDLYQRTRGRRPEAAVETLAAVMSFTKRYRAQEFVDFFEEYNVRSERWVQLQEAIG